MTKRIGSRAVPGTEVPGLGESAYHVWFSPRRRRRALDGDIYPAVVRLIKDVASRQAIELLEMAGSYDHIHLLLRPPEGMPLASAMQFLKGVSSRYLFLEFPELKLDLGLNNFWQRGYGYRLVAPRGLFAVRTYIRNHRAAEDHSPVAPPEPRTSVRGSDAVRTETS